MSKKIYRNARIYSPVDLGRPSSGEEQGHVVQYHHGALIVQNGLVESIGEESEVLTNIKNDSLIQEYDCGGRCLIPGFVDPHTHCCFAALRESEFDLRVAGTPYLDILAKGGGILSSVKAVADATVDHLYAVTKKHVMRAMSFGTTSIEIKSGYGLTTETELKMLEAIDRVAADTPLDVVATFLGAHAIPPQFKNNPDDFITLIIEEMLPAVQKQGIARYCDVFCETGVFSIEQGRRLLQAAQKIGLGAKIHADEVDDLGGAGLAAELQAVSGDHLLAASDENLVAMAKAGVVANLLPATAYSLRKPYARARAMIAANVPVALATDCNPGSSFTESMPFIFGLAVLNMQMTPLEALVGATLNSAYAIGMADRVGSLDVGKQADFLLLDGQSPSILAYHAGVSPVQEVYKKGEKIANI